MSMHMRLSLSELKEISLVWLRCNYPGSIG